MTSHRDRSAGQWGLIVIEYVTMFVLLATIMVPILFMLSYAIRPPSELLNPLYLIPNEITLDNLYSSFGQLTPFLINSFLVSAGTALVSLFIAVPGAYAFARKDFPWQGPLFYIVITALLLPYLLLVIPLINMWYMLDLYNTIPGLIIAYQVFVTPFAVWILYDFFKGMPQNLEEAAQVYGCTQFSAFVRVILPIAAPGLVAVAFLTFLTAWNDFLFASLLTTGSGTRTAVVSLFIDTLGGETTEWTTLMAKTLIIGLPPTALYLIARRQLGQTLDMS